MSKLGLLNSNMGEVKNVSINWKNVNKFQQNKLTLAKQQYLHSNSGQVEHLYSFLGNFKQLYSFLGNFKQFHSNLYNIYPLSLNLHTFGNIWANSNSLIWVIETASV